MVVAYLVKKFIVFYGTVTFITVYIQIRLLHIRQQLQLYTVTSPLLSRVTKFVVIL